MKSKGIPAWLPELSLVSQSFLRIPTFKQDPHLVTVKSHGVYLPAIKMLIHGA